jgi:L-lactate dehydrogenase
MIDSSRYKQLISEKLSVNPQSVSALILGEHGDTSVPVISQANISGLLLRHDSSLDLVAMHKNVVHAAYDVIALKGYTCWAIGACTKALVNAIAGNELVVLPISTSAAGKYGIVEDVYLSLPCVVGREGAGKVLEIDLSHDEVRALQASAKALREVIDALPPF